MKQVWIKISGQVQGVNFRYSASQKARDLGLSGWVRNVLDGTLEILAQGEKENLQKLLDWAKTGPAFAKINKVEINWEETHGELKNFEIRDS